MKFSAVSLLMLSTLLLCAGTASCAPADAGHIEFVDPQGGGSNPNPINSNRLLPNIAALREVILTSELKQKILAHFPNERNKDVYSLLGNSNVVMNADARELTGWILSHLEEMKEEILLAFPEFTVSRAGIYVLGVVMNDIADAWTLIDSLSSITRSGVSSAADIPQVILLDQKADRLDIKRTVEGANYSVVPQNQNLIVAVNFNAGDTWSSSLTKASQLPLISVENITIEQIISYAEQNDPQARSETHEQTSDRITGNIIEILREILSRHEVEEYITDNNILSRDIFSRRIVSSDIKTFTSRDIIAGPEEPTQAMIDAVRQDGYQITAKLNTIQVSESGFYIFKVNLSEQAFNELRGAKANEVRAYALNDSEANVRLSFITGLINTFELLTMSGEKMTSIGVREFLLIGLLESSKPLSVYLAKIIIMLLMGGCSLNKGIIAVIAVSAVMIRVNFYRNRK